MPDDRSHATRVDWGFWLSALCVLDCAALPFLPHVVPESLHWAVAAAAFALAGRRALASLGSGHGARPLGFLVFAAFFWLASAVLEGNWVEFAHAVGSLSLVSANLSACQGCRHAPEAAPAAAYPDAPSLLARPAASIAVSTDGKR